PPPTSLLFPYTTLFRSDAASTGLAPGSFDVVMLRHVLGHNGGRQREIVGHLRSLLRAGGCLYLVDTDLTGLRIYPPDPGLRDMRSEEHTSELQSHLNLV